MHHNKTLNNNQPLTANQNNSPKKILNNRGSISITILLVMFLTTLTLLLTSLYISQKENFDSPIKQTPNEALYQKDRVYTVAVNLTKQYLSKITRSSITNSVWSGSDSSALSTTLTTNSYPSTIGAYTAYIEQTKSVPLTNLCYELPPTQNTTTALAQLDCRDTTFDLPFDVTVTQGKKTFDFSFVITSIRPYTILNNQKIAFDLSNSKVITLTLKSSN